MARIFKRTAKDGGNLWYLSYWDEYGHNRTRSLGRVDRRTAEKILKIFEGNRSLGLVGIQPKKVQRVNMEDFAVRYLEFSRSTKSPKTAEMDEHFLRLFADFMGDIELSSIRRADIESYIRFGCRRTMYRGSWRRMTSRSCAKPFALTRCETSWNSTC